ncbi:hypothetical protein M0R45_007364 [Rubus argutus]|uniref:Uncharacterized protein n=1 Tax=Rubus argutus TaxID=59490 RepID=A0AAW1Y047_RUBAR
MESATMDADCMEMDKSGPSSSCSNETSFSGFFQEKTTYQSTHTYYIEILKGDRRHILIKIGNQEGGLCSNYGINKALAALTSCILFLNVSVVLPADSIRKSKKYLSEKHAERHGMDNLEQPNVDYLGTDKSGPSLDVSGMPEITSFSTRFLIGREKEVQEAWPSVHSFIEEHGISCTRTENSTRTTDPDIMDKAGVFLEMLARTSIPA